MQTSTGVSAAAVLQQRFSDCALFHDDDNWADHEIAGCVFKDARLGCRFGKLLKRMGCAMGESIPLVCQDWANEPPRDCRRLDGLSYAAMGTLSMAAVAA